MIFLLFVSITGWVLWSVYSYFIHRWRSIAGKTVLITGGCSDFGKCLILRFLQLGAKVVVWDWNQTMLDKLTDEISELRSTQNKEEEESDELNRDSETCLTQNTAGANSKSSHFTTNVVDISNYSQVNRAIKQLGSVHIIVNAADLRPTKKFLFENNEITERFFLYNVLSQLWLFKALLPGMLQEKGGHFVTITNTAGVMGLANHPNYAASQWAKVGAHESIQMMLKQNKESGKVRTTIIYLNNDVQNFSSKSASQPQQRSNDEAEEVPPAKSLPWSFFCKRHVFTPEAIANSCVWAVCHGIERVYMPSHLLFLPLLRVLPVPWLLYALSFFA